MVKFNLNLHGTKYTNVKSWKGSCRYKRNYFGTHKLARDQNQQKQMASFQLNERFSPIFYSQEKSKTEIKKRYKVI